MLPPFLGALMLVGTAGFLIMAAAVGLWARRHNPRLARRAGIAGTVVLGLYAAFWILGLALSRTAVLAPGEEISFCGLDCHLKVSVEKVRTGDSLGVTVRFRSNARQAPEWPGELRFRLRDASGREFSPVASVPADRELRAGDSWPYELVFPAGVTPAGSVLIVTWAPGLDYLVPGAGNPLVQRRLRLALPVAGGA